MFSAEFLIETAHRNRGSFPPIIQIIVFDVVSWSWLLLCYFWL